MSRPEQRTTAVVSRNATVAALSRPHFALAHLMFLCIAAILAACATAPAPQQRASDAGVTVVAQRAAWDGFPATVEGRLDPVRITISNHSGRPVRVQPDEMALIELDGDVRPALARMDLEGRVPTLSADAGGSGSSAVPGPYLPVFRGGPHSDIEWVDLPSREMQGRALPAGVLADNGSVDGFVWFAEPDPGLARVRLRFDLIDASTGERFGRILVPLPS